MRHSFSHRPLQRRGRQAFSVIELMLAIAILGIIVFALYTVFNQTQRALRASETSIDVGERGRAVLEMLSREMEQAQPLFSPFVTNFYTAPDYFPQVQKDPNAPEMARTNMLYTLMFPIRETNRWSLVGYKIDLASNRVGVLKRFAWTNNVFYNVSAPDQLILVQSNFMKAPLSSTNFHHFADGVIHFKINTYNHSGGLLTFDTTNRFRPRVSFDIYRMNFSGAAVTPAPVYSDASSANDATVLLQQAFPQVPYETISSYRSNAVPAYVELEVGVLEPETLKQYYLMLEEENPNAANFLARQIARVHIFRQRIPIRTAAQ